MKERAPAYQRYVKQILGDDKVLAMDWDAFGMHNWLLDLSWQQDPRGTVPNDQNIIRRWLRSPSDEVWRRVWPQIKDAWFLLDGRLANAGMIRTAMRSKTYRNNAAKREQSYGDEEEVLVLAFDLQEPKQIPVWIPEEAWKAFCEMRQKIRHPMTDKAKQLIIADLLELREKGNDPGEVLLQSVKKSWRGVFELTNGSGYGTGANKAESRQSANVTAIQEGIRRRSAHEAGNDPSGDADGIKPDDNGRRDRPTVGKVGVPGGEVRRSKAASGVGPMAGAGEILAPYVRSLTNDDK